MARMSKNLKDKIAKMRSRYIDNKKVPVGSTCYCPACDTEFIKTRSIQVFCQTKGGTKCKDLYYNTLVSERRNEIEANYLEQRIIIDEQ